MLYIRANAKDIKRIEIILSGVPGSKRFQLLESMILDSPVNKSVLHNNSAISNKQASNNSTECNNKNDHFNNMNHGKMISIESLLDALLVLYDECCNSSLRREKTVSDFIELGKKYFLINLYLLYLAK